ncbi:phage terminase small subunit [Enterococcus wangshanyuanii]|uniref:PBSX phage terminase small subunit-like N-terminal domain-containing protein n=1 Tax=Enterococcus wangshanyuanii TaxID=2005703 RepID=A0ABQ1NZI3_9ENTE|nr:phage terminase small subunit [Enterococcus wangshanyuanii]GGC87896.1 hypothetical protein GCM10011573_16940 [Enterococcus wangshanyuanii]
MARKRDPRRDKAFELFKENAGNIANRKIAEILDVPEKTISGWKSKDRWNNKMNGVLQTDERSTPNNKGSTKNRGGAPLGNQNAKGNKGNSEAAPPVGNKNAVTTGEFESLYSDYLDDEEKDLLQLEVDPFLVLQKEINLLRIRQSRMLKRIAEAEKDLNTREQNLLYELRGRKKIVESKGKQVAINNPELIITEKRVKETPKIELILRIEDALTRVNNSLTKAIKQLSDIDMDKTRKGVYIAQEKKLKAETNEIGGASTTDEVEDWKKAVIDAANKRVVKDNG